MLLALTGVGLFAIAVKASIAAFDSVYNKKPYTFNNALFFAKTTSEELNEEIEERFELVELAG